MGLLDPTVDRCFRTEKGGRVVVFPGDRAYLLRSEADEPKIKSFLKMFIIAQISILVLGQFLANAWARDIYYALDKPTEHLFRAMAIAAAMSLLVMGIPCFFLWRSYKKALFSFVSPQDQVTVSGKQAWQPRLILIGIVAIALAALLFWLVRAK